MTSQTKISRFPFTAAVTLMVTGATVPAWAQLAPVQLAPIGGRPVYYNPDRTPPTVKELQTDVCVYGGNSAGVAAALQVARSGKKTIILEPSNHLGGLSAGGLGETDIGNKAAIGGIAHEFYQRIGQKYGMDEEWRFEPHVAEQVFKEMATEAKAQVYYRQFLRSVKKERGHLVSVTMENGLTVRAKMFIDASYEGDLMAKAGVKYTVGRESNATYGETINGVQVHNAHQFDLPVSPYRVEGDPTSGLLPGITAGYPGATGSGDKRIQAYNFRLCLTNDPSNRIPFEKPAGYNPAEYTLLARYLKAGWPEAEVFRKFDPIHNSRNDQTDPTLTLFGVSDIRDAQGLLGRLKKKGGPFTLYLMGRFSPDLQSQIEVFDEKAAPSQSLVKALADDLNRIIQDPANGTGPIGVTNGPVQICSLYTPELFAKVNLSPLTKTWLQGNPQGQDLVRLNRRLLQEAYPGELGPKKYLKVDKNNHGAVSTDYIGQNYDYPEASYTQREKIFQAHVTYQKGLMWFLGNDPSVPENIRARWSEWGLPKDEFLETGGWPHQLYVREARRMVGQYVMTEANCRGKAIVTDPVGLAAYTMDSHNCQRFVKDGRVWNEGDVQARGFPPYPISYGSIVPKKAECDNLLVPVCLSASHIAYGSIRMEPVFMILGQSAAYAASLAIDKGIALQDVVYSDLKGQLLAGNQLLAWNNMAATNAPTQAVVTNAITTHPNPPETMTDLPLAKATPDTALVQFFKRLDWGQKQTVVVYGTSLTAGGAWADELKKRFEVAYPGQVKFINSALSGKNSDDGVAQLQGKVLNNKPDLVFVEFSINDSHVKFNMPVERGAQNLDKIVSAIKAQNPLAAVVLQVMDVPWDASNGNRSFSDRPQLQAFNDNYRKYARDHALPLLDHNPAWLKMQASYPAKYHEFLPDGLHPTKEGNLAIIWPAVQDLLEQARAAK